MPRTPEQLALIALSPAEYDEIVARLDREPNDLELGMFGAMWSEHCGYKNSKPLLRRFPSTGPRVLTTRGGENAGAIDVGDGLCAVFKIESHNHPSAIEPYQGAATGVGGIVRDIFAMGARPIALLDSLRFGPLEAGVATDEARAGRNRTLFRGVVGGIGGYGNCLGVPTIGGEVSFAASYNGNPLVNAMCLGVARTEHLLRAIASGVDNPIILVGADTGRDGIGGANVLASRTFEQGQEELRPTVQVGNPFLEKLLMEACVALAEEHGDWVVGLQDLGAAGLTSSLVECAARGGSGIEIDVARVPRREAGMTPTEVMLSESQERMVVVAHKEHTEDVLDHFRRWEIAADVIGRVSAGGKVKILDGDAVVGEVPATLFTEPPEYVRDGIASESALAARDFDLSSLVDITIERAQVLLPEMLALPEITSKRWIWRQYDHQVLTNTVVGPGADAAVIRLKDASPRGLAMATDGNSVLCFLDPFAGGALAVAEACRNVACTGAQPVAITDCLNFGNPERLDVYHQLESAVSGMIAACEALGVPVISGNVSLFNESDGDAIYPTPVIGAVGVIEDVAMVVPSGFQAPGHDVFLAGDIQARGHSGDLAGSEFLRYAHGLVAGRPEIDLGLEARLQAFLTDSAAKGLLASAHDCSHGGLLVALAECCLAGMIALEGEMELGGGRLDALLFGERASRVVISVDPSLAEALLDNSRAHDLPMVHLGRTGGHELRLASALGWSLNNLRESYDGGLEAALAYRQ